MRRVLGLGGSVVAIACALVAAACSDERVIRPSFATAVGGAPIAGGSTSAGGSLGIGGGLQIPAMSACDLASPLFFAATRYSVIEVDASLDLVFGKAAPRLAEVPGVYDTGYQRDVSRLFITALGDVARERVQQAAKEAASLEVCHEDDQAGSECLQTWLRKYGDPLYRRPLSRQQIAAYVVPFLAAESAADREIAAENALVAMILSPYFVLRLESAEASTGRISPYDVAARLSHLAARHLPDSALRASAAAGELQNPSIRLQHLHRLWGTSAGRAARELQVLEWLGLEPATSNARLDSALAADMAAQTRAFIGAVLDQQNGGISAFLTSSRLPLNDRLAEHLGWPAPGSEELVPTDLDPQLFSGLLTTGSFLSRYPGPSQRGFAVMRGLLCVEPPPAPPSLHETAPPPADTPRQSLEGALSQSPACVKCHDTFDPVGFALEAFDAQGRLSGFPTYGSVTLDPLRPPTPLADPAALGTTIANSREAAECLTRRSLEFVLQRGLLTTNRALRSTPPPGELQQPVVVQADPERQWQDCLLSALNSPEPSLTALMEAIVLSPLMDTRDDRPPRVDALDTSPNPIEHAYQETLQLQGAYAGDETSDLRRYLQGLADAGNLIEPTGSAGAGAGGDSGEGGAGGAF